MSEENNSNKMTEHDIKKQKTNSLFPLSHGNQHRPIDPVKLLMEVMENSKISPEDRTRLIEYTINRFSNRRKMAYWSLTAIILSLVFLVAGSIFDGTSMCVADESCNGILKSISSSESLFIWIEGFLAAIVGTYYGVSSFRPSS